MQRRAKKMSDQASKLAEQAGPMARSAATTARLGAGNAAEWATPHVHRARGWLAVKARRGSVSVQETVGPKVSEMLAATAHKLDPPARRARRLPKVLAAITLLAAGAAAAAAMAMKNRQGILPMPVPPRQATSPEESGDVLAPGSESAVNGLSRSK
jgi:hypothetical protein